MEATAVALFKSSALSLVTARMIHFLVAMSSSISLPPQLSPGSLEEDDNVVEPLDGQPGNRLNRVLAEFLLVARITTKYIIVGGP